MDIMETGATHNYEQYSRQKLIQLHRDRDVADWEWSGLLDDLAECGELQNALDEEMQRFRTTMSDEFGRPREIGPDGKFRKELEERQLEIYTFLLDVARNAQRLTNLVGLDYKTGAPDDD